MKGSHKCWALLKKHQIPLVEVLKYGVRCLAENSDWQEKPEKFRLVVRWEFIMVRVMNREGNLQRR